MVAFQMQLGDASLEYQPIETATMGEAAPAIVVPVNPLRQALILRNTSDVDGHLAFGEGVGLTITASPIKLAAGEIMALSAGISQQQIVAVCGAVDKDVCFQEAI